jgi:hypothetical protein
MGDADFQTVFFFLLKGNNMISKRGPNFNLADWKEKIKKKH